ncbi:MAG: rhodanese-like domain-containing protein [Verrucomicrobiia bacterium]
MKLAVLLVLGLMAVGGVLQTAEPAPSPPAARQGTSGTAPQKIKNVTSAEFEAMRAKSNTVVLDVRTAKEFAAGRIPNAVNIDIKSPDFEKKVKELDSQKIYLVHCATGRRSVTACEKLDKLNFPNAYNLEGGIQAWEKAGNKPERNRPEP